MAGQVTERKIEIKAVLAQIAHEHRGEGNGNLHIADIVDWMRSAAPEDRQLMREILMEDFGSALPGRTGWIALAALADDADPAIAAQLDSVGRSVEGRSQSREVIVQALAQMGYRPSLDLCLELLRTGLGDRARLLAYLIRLDPEPSVEMAARYFAAGLNSNDESQRRWTRNSAAQFLWVYARVSPDHVIQLVIKTLKASAAAGRVLLSAISEASAMWAKQNPDLVRDGVVASMEQRLQEIAAEQAPDVLNSSLSD
jgi:hypothetical protein